MGQIWSMGSSLLAPVIDNKVLYLKDVETEAFAFVHMTELVRDRTSEAHLGLRSSVVRAP